MRILHTSDWHLGRSFHGEDLLAAQAAYVDHLVATVESEQVDVVALAGDVYDRALPPVDAVALADECFHRLASSRARLVVTSGNHDSPRRLGFNSRLVDLAGIHLRTDPARLDEPVLLDDAHGQVAVYGIPYLEPDVLRSAWDLPARSHQAAMAHAADPGARRPGHAARHARRGARPCLRGRRHAQRQRARHRGRRGRDGAAGALRGPRLRRAGPPARPAPPSAGRCATAAHPSPTPSPRPGTSRAPGWSTSAPPGSPRPSSSRPRSPGLWPASRAPSTAARATRGTPSTRPRGCRPP